MLCKDSYSPRGAAAAALQRGLELVESVPYAVSARWVFYRLLQEGWYSGKKDYANKWLKAVSRARHAFWGGWRPDTLADETRQAIGRGHGYRTPNEWLDALAQEVACTLAYWYTQSYYVELWFEARAMADQFRHYTQHITLRPMGGQPSIPYKWQAAKDLEAAARVYGHPVVILYFGDLDAGGECIEEVVENDVAKWCIEPFDFIRCGLNPAHAEQYGIPENPERPGEYQWEALSDDGAQDVITSNVDRFVHGDAFEIVVEQEAEATEWLRQELSGLVVGDGRGVV